MTVSKSELNNLQGELITKTEWNEVNKTGMSIRAENKGRNTGIVFEFYEDEYEGNIGHWFGVGELHMQRGEFSSTDEMLRLARKYDDAQ